MRIPTPVFAAVAALAAATLSWSGVAAASPAPPKCSDLSGVMVGGQTCQIQASDPGYTMTISYPTDYPDLVAVTDYVKQTRDGFLNVAKTPDGRDMPYELETTVQEYNSTVPRRGTESAVFKTYQGVGGAHPLTYYKSFNWDQGLGKPITIDTLFREGTQPFPLILPVVQSELEKQLGQPVNISPAAGLDPTKYQNFAITNDAIIFFFSQGELLPEAAGAVQVSVPRGPFDSMIN
ncbi:MULTISPECIES: esterase [unclassified Mycobacterium]|uniref:esterase n=1 Tax=unclassified Mycobacterium TaxID=2642494 RepID=UPI0029C687DB|nr:MULTISPECIES: esterase [unclassified Mycobacterium]